jgi:hypothetical protein
MESACCPRSAASVRCPSSPASRCPPPPTLLVGATARDGVHGVDELPKLLGEFDAENLVHGRY